LTGRLQKTHFGIRMSSFHIRPRFSQTVDLELEAVQERIVNHIDQEDSRCEVKRFPEFLSLRIPEKDAHFWSPQLNLSLEATEDGKTIIHGIYGPNPNVWSLFLYGYLIVGSLAVFAAIFGFSQWAIGRQPWGLWVLGVMLVFALGLYIVAQFGQKLGAWQTFLLHQTYEAAIGRSARIL
jgi:hypothetical protein